MDDVTLTGQAFLTKVEQAQSDDARCTASDLPLHLLQQAARRLRTVASLVIAITAASWIGVNLLEGEFWDEFRRPADWIPPTLGLLLSGIVYGVARSPRIAPTTIIQFGLAYQVVVSYSMALGQYWNTFRGLSAERLTADLVGVSGVALWMAFFTVIVPARPRKALVALLLSGSAVPVTIAVLIRVNGAPSPQPMDFFFIFVFPYLITIAMCLVAANIIYGLGCEVRRAQQMGSYQLERLIGRGGMGEVWSARHNLLARRAAIKLIRRDALSTDPAKQQAIIARFEQEAQVISRLESPHTVDLYDFGVSDDGSLFYVMELLNGMDLDSFVKRFGPLAPERTVHLLSQVCSSLAEAHHRGLIHRDIKPANIELCAHALEYDFVKVLDFGLVKRLPEMSGNGDLAVSRADMVAGTPAFLAPELATNKGTIDGRADLYSLGCVAFWLLTGRPLFDEESPVAMIVAHANTPAPRPNAHTEMSVPEALDDLVLACLAKRPEDRPESAHHLARQLERIHFESPWTRERAQEWWSAHQPVDMAAMP